MDDKLKILKMIEEGKITVEEGEELLNALDDIESMGDEKIVVMDSGDDESSSEPKWVTSESTSLTLGATVKMIDLRMVSTDIHIEGYEGDKIEITADPYESKPLTERLSISNDGDVLTIGQFDKKQFKFDMNNLVDSLMKSFATFTETVDQVILRIPQDYSGALKLKTVSGDVVVENLDSVKSVQVRTVSGDLDASNTVGSFGHQSVSGNGKIKLKALNGNVSLGSVSGDFKLQIPENSDFKCKFSSTSGVFKDKYSDSGNKVSQRFEGTIGNGQYNVSCKTTSGDFKLTKA